MSAARTCASSSTCRRTYRADERAILIGHDWGANAGYGVVASIPTAFGRFVALAVPPVAALAAGMFSYPQVKRSFYIWFIQQVGLAEAALVTPGFWEGLWEDWSPGYDPRDDVAELRRYVTADNIASVICPYRASFNRSEFADPDAEAEAAATHAAAAGADAVSARRRRRGDRRGIAGRRRRALARRRIGLRNHGRRWPFPASGAARPRRGEDR